MNKFLSTPGLWLDGVFHFLPFSSIQILASVNRYLRLLSRLITHPTHLGIYPIGFWSHYILTLLSYQDLKKFQRVSEVAKRLTTSKKLANTLFRSDVKISALKRIEQGVSLNTREYTKKGPKDTALNPFFRAISYSVPPEYEDVYAWTDKEYTTKCLIESFNVSSEKATNPPVPPILIEGFDPSTSYFSSWGSGGPPRTIGVVGSGRPIFGGKHCSVTVRDVMKALI